MTLQWFAQSEPISKRATLIWALLPSCTYEYISKLGQGYLKADPHPLIMLQQLTRRSVIRMARSTLAAARAFSSAAQGPLLSTADVQELLDAKDDSVRLVDASWYEHGT